MSKPVDQNKIQKIVCYLKQHPKGTYISEIARGTKLPKSTVNYLLATQLKDKIEEIIVGKKGLFKIIRMKVKK